MSVTATLLRQFRLAKTKPTQPFKLGCLSVSTAPPTTAAPVRPESLDDFLRALSLRNEVISPYEGVKVFSGVPSERFVALERAVEEGRFPQKIRLSYDPNGILIVEVPTPAHGNLITGLRKVLQLALDRLPIDPMHFCVDLATNTTLRSARTGFSTIPGLALVAGSTGIGSPPTPLAFAECAFSQDYSELIKKVKSEVEGFPEFALAVLILVSERKQYQSPEPNSPTWRFFSQYTNRCLNPTEFHTLPRSIKDCISHVSVSPSALATPAGPSNSEDSTRGLEPFRLKPFTAAGHTWCDISKVHYQIWLKKKGVIDLDGSPEGVGVLYPSIDMNSAEQAIQSGLSAVKTEITKLAMAVESESMLQKLHEAELKADFNWSEMQARLGLATAWTAQSRYYAWYHDIFRRTKRSRPDDDDHQQSSSSMSSESQDIV